MAFSKIIISQVVKMAKESGKLEDLIESSKEKFIGEVESKINSKVPIPLPFGVKDVLLGNVVLDKSTVISYLPSKEEAITMGIDKIPENIKIQINETLDNLEDTLNQVVGKTNQIKSGLNTILLPLNTLNILGTTLKTISQSLDAVIISMEVFQKASPTPPPGVPLYPFTGLPQDVKDGAEFINVPIKGASSILPPLLKQINGAFSTVYAALEVVDGLIIPSSMLISFLRTLINSNPETFQEDFDENLNSTISKTINSIPTTGLSSNPNANSNLDGDLEERLKPNSPNPIFHRGYRLTLQYDDKNKFSFPSRRIKGVTKTRSTDPILYHSIDNSYTYTSSLLVMVGEMKNRIDNSLVIPVVEEPLIPEIPEIPDFEKYSPFLSKGDFEGEIRKQGTDYYKFSSSSPDNQWKLFTPNHTPISRPGRYSGERVSFKIKRNNGKRRGSKKFEEWWEDDPDRTYAWVEILGGSLSQQKLKWEKQ